MKRLLQLLWAHIRCECYLLRHGMWKGECKLVTWDLEHKVSLIGVVQPNKLMEVRRTFYISDELQKEVQCQTTVSAPAAASPETCRSTTD